LETQLDRLAFDHAEAVVQWRAGLRLAIRTDVTQGLRHLLPVPGEGR